MKSSVHIKTIPKTSRETSTLSEISIQQKKLWFFYFVVMRFVLYSTLISKLFPEKCPSCLPLYLWRGDKSCGTSCAEE